MQDIRLIMGMPITVRILGDNPAQTIASVFAFFTAVDERFSTYKPQSEISRINRGELARRDASSEMQEVLGLADETKQLTDGYFDVYTPEGQIDPSGLVKGWAIKKAADLIAAAGYENFYVEAGGDIQASGHNEQGQAWTVGIKNPFNPREIIKVLKITNQGVATSGTYERGNHIYNPHSPKQALSDIVSLTVIGPNVYEADRFATAAFAMGTQGISFIENLSEFAGYQIDRRGQALFTNGLTKYLN